MIEDVKKITLFSELDQKLPNCSELSQLSVDTFTQDNQIKRSLKGVNKDLEFLDVFNLEPQTTTEVQFKISQTDKFHGCEDNFSSDLESLNTSLFNSHRAETETICPANYELLYTPKRQNKIYKPLREKKNVIVNKKDQLRKTLFDKFTKKTGVHNTIKYYEKKKRLTMLRNKTSTLRNYWQEKLDFVPKIFMFTHKNSITGEVIGTDDLSLKELFLNTSNIF